MHEEHCAGGLSRQMAVASATADTEFAVSGVPALMQSNDGIYRLSVFDSAFGIRCNVSA